MIGQVLLMVAIFAASFFAITGHVLRVRNRRLRVITHFAALAVMLAGVVLYAYLGEPGRGDAPLALRGDEIAAAEAGSAAQEAEARTALAEAIAAAEAAPDSIEARLNLAEAAARAGDTATEIAALEAVLARDDNPAIKSLLAEALGRDADGFITPKALALIDSALADDPGEMRARYLKGLYFSQSGDDAAALRLWVPLSVEVAGTPLFPAIREAVLFAAGRQGHDTDTIAREMDRIDRLRRESITGGDSGGGGGGDSGGGNDN